MKRLAYCVVALVSVWLPTATNAVLYDLKADWSDTTNPNDVWSYWVNGALAISGTRGMDNFSGAPPPIWTALGVANCLGWSMSQGTEAFQTPGELLAGDVYGHAPDANSAPIEIRWTSPADGIADVSGNTWHLRDIGRTDTWQVLLNSQNGQVLLASGTTSSGDLHGRSNPWTFGSSGLIVNAGDTIVFSAVGSGVPDYLGVNFTVSLSAIPEPSTYLAGALLLIPFGVSTLRRIRARK